MTTAATRPEHDPWEEAMQQAIDLAGGDLRAALKAQIVACWFLEQELEAIAPLVSKGYARGRCERAHDGALVEHGRSPAPDPGNSGCGSDSS